MQIKEKVFLILSNLIGKIVIDYLNKKYSRGTTRPDSAAPTAYADQRRPYNQEHISQPQNQYPSGQNQYPSNKGYQLAGNMSSYQQPFQQPQVRSVPQQPRPAMPQSPRPQQQGNIPPVQGRMAPPPIMPTQKPVQQSFYNKTAAPEWKFAAKCRLFYPCTAKSSTSTKVQQSSSISEFWWS